MQLTPHVTLTPKQVQQAIRLIDRYLCTLLSARPKGV